MMMSVVMIMLMARSNSSAYRITKLFDSGLESRLRSLGCIILYSNRLVLKRDLEILHAFLKSDVFLDLLHAVLTMEMNGEYDLLDFAFLLL